jgi:hypothetical protein
MSHTIHDWLARFKLDAALHDCACQVLAALPEPVRQDFLGDPAFHLCDYEPLPGVAVEVPVAAPALNRAGRSIVLKRTLNLRPRPFALYVIAHEFAHAHLRNGGRVEDEDPEHAADALAAEWGFPKVGWY